MITAVNNSKVKRIIQLQNRAKARREAGCFVVEGLRMFCEAPEASIAEIYVTEDFLRKTQMEQGLYEVAGKKLQQRAYEIVSKEVMERMADTVTPQGILCVVRMHFNPLESILKGEAARYLLIENVQDPGNLGTMFRTAEAAGVQGILMSQNTVDIYNPKVIRSTMGSIFRMPFVIVEDLPGCIEQMKEKNISVYAAALDGAKDYRQETYEGSVGILIGNEGNGLTREAIAAATKAIYIPMSGKVESLNASISAAILLYHIKNK